MSVFLSTTSFICFCTLDLSNTVVSVMSVMEHNDILISFLFNTVMFHRGGLGDGTISLTLMLVNVVFLCLKDQWTGGAKYSSSYVPHCSLLLCGSFVFCVGHFF